MHELLCEQFRTRLRGDLQSGTEHKYDSLKNFADLEDADKSSVTGGWKEPVGTQLTMEHQICRSVLRLIRASCRS